MKKIKSVCFAMLLFFATIFLTACTAVDFAVINFPDGRIEHVFAMRLDRDILIESGLTPAQTTSVVSGLRTRLTNLRLEMTTAFRQQVDSIENISSYERLRLRNGLESEVREENNVMSLHFRFQDSDVLCHFEKASAFRNIVSERAEEPGTFTTRVSWTIETIYGQPHNSENPNSPTIARHFLNEYRALIVSYGSEVTWVNLQMRRPFTIAFSYLTYSARLRSDATTRTSFSGGFLHTWQISADGDGIVTLYYFRIHPVAWYVLAISLTLAFLTVLFLIVGIRKIISNKKIVESSVSN